MYKTLKDFLENAEIGEAYGYQGSLYAKIGVRNENGVICDCVTYKVSPDGYFSHPNYNDDEELFQVIEPGCQAVMFLGIVDDYPYSTDYRKAEIL